MVGVSLLVVSLALLVLGSRLVVRLPVDQFKIAYPVFLVAMAAMLVLVLGAAHADFSGGS